MSKTPEEERLRGILRSFFDALLGEFRDERIDEVTAVHDARAAALDRAMAKQADVEERLNAVCAALSAHAAALRDAEKRGRLEGLRWAVDKADISLPDTYSQPCLDEVVEEIRAEIERLEKEICRE